MYSCPRIIADVTFFFIRFYHEFLTSALGTFLFSTHFLHLFNYNPSDWYLNIKNFLVFPVIFYFFSLFVSIRTVCSFMLCAGKSAAFFPCLRKCILTLSFIALLIVWSTSKELGVFGESTILHFDFPCGAGNSIMLSYVKVPLFASCFKKL